MNTARQDALRNPDHRHVAWHVLAQGVQHLPQVPLGRVQETVVVQRPAAAHVPVRHDDPPARGLDRLDAGHADLGVQVVVERVGEQHHRPAGFFVPPRWRNHCCSVIGRERGQRPPPVNPGGQLGQPGQARGLQKEVDHLGHQGRQPRGLVVDVAEAYAYRGRHRRRDW